MIVSLVGFLLGVHVYVAVPAAQVDEISQQAVQAALARAAKTAARNVPGPLLVDHASFRRAAATLGEPSISGANVLAGASREVVDMSSEDAILCRQVTPVERRDCRVAHNGLLLAIDSTVRTEAGAIIFIRITWTLDRGASAPKATAFNTLRLTFAKSGRGWSLIKQEVYSRS